MPRYSVTSFCCIWSCISFYSRRQVLIDSIIVFAKFSRRTDFRKRGDRKRTTWKCRTKKWRTTCKAADVYNYSLTQNSSTSHAVQAALLRWTLKIGKTNWTRQGVSPLLTAGWSQFDDCMAVQNVTTSRSALLYTVTAFNGSKYWMHSKSFKQ